MEQMRLKKKERGQWIRLTYPPVSSGILESTVLC